LIQAAEAARRVCVAGSQELIRAGSAVNLCSHILMSHFMKVKKIGLLNLKTACSAALAISSSVLPAMSHGVIFPPLHTNLSHFALNSHSAFVLPGAGSTSLRLNSLLIKQTITGSYAAGQNFAINNAIGGAVTGGLLKGNLFPYSPPTSNVSNPGISYGFGNAFTGNTFVSGNFINFANAGGGFKHGVATGGGGGFSGFSGKPLTGSAFSKGFVFSGASGSERAVNNFYKTLSGSSALAGEKSITSLGNITGGQFVGVIGTYTPTQLNNYVNVLYAFGNAPNASLSVVHGTQTSFLDFSSGVTRQITSGQLHGTFYTAGSNDGMYGLSFGASPFNHLGLFSSSGFNNIINLAPLFAKLK
jgi:hypothetical protein